MGMTELMNRRRAMMGSKEEPTTYVQDGLVLWLDGINQGSTSNAWTDLIGGHVFSGGTTTVYGNDYVEFGGATSARLTNSSFDPPNYTAGTIEIVYEVSDSISTRAYVLFAPKRWLQLAFGMYDNTAIYSKSKFGTSIPAKTYPKYTSGTYSVSYALGSHNGLTQNSVGVDFWADDERTTNVIGGILNNANRTYKGKIYCIRIYNRRLKASEVVRNYKVDRNRFSLFQS